MKKIIIIDDDEKLGQLLTQYLERYDMEVYAEMTPSRGLKLIKKVKPNLLILDVMLPEKDGFEVCREIRAKSSIYGQLPILMLTAHAEVTDRIVGLELGADDYLPKPFEPRELVARINNILRRSGEDDGKREIKPINGLEVEISRREVRLDGKPLDLTTMEYELLVLFMQFPNKTFTRDELMNRLRGIDAELFSRAVDTLVSRLRNKLKDTSKTPRFIKTIWGRGYTFVGEQI
ncbi:MAG: DNA-binding response regulator [Gammaproteobacteria bacterium]|nr:DNA-binding response regulator [Gammaproteobacteria bacterium]MEC7765977.1 response regulator transcription factor [Pseudomonadota bacterium]MED5529292.1 response regulator transcription factor [Pseudomonadota bacterium]HBX99692.1 DNA-binding response regulator [Gammaproteobacteria bacterium]|tara:strand:+ start:12348 stop:13046 length:699 start_codon:yes stop_codon:yes gene_type:complete